MIYEDLEEQWMVSYIATCLSTEKYKIIPSSDVQYTFELVEIILSKLNQIKEVSTNLLAGIFELQCIQTGKRISRYPSI